MDNELPPHPPVWPAVTRETWRERVSEELGDRPLESLHSLTEDGLDLAPLYSASDMPAVLPRPNIPAGATGWDIRAESSRPAPEAAASALRDDLAGGATSVLLRIDAGRATGGDGAHAAARPFGAGSAGAASHVAESAGFRGVRIRTLADLDAALEGVHLQMIPVALDAGADFVAAAAALAELWKQREVPLENRVGEFGADPLGALSGNGSLPTSAEDSLAQLGELAAWTTSELPGVAAVRVGTGVYSDAGCTAVQEIGIALATGLTYMRALTAAGLSAGAAARQLVFDLRAGTEQFQEIAKLRAFRLCWQRALELLEANDAPVRITSSLAGRNISRRDPWVNMLRGTMGCFVAVVGGADTVTVPPFDSALGIPDPVALRLARNTQHVLNEEAHIGEVSDPAAGSWFVESLTQRMSEAGWNLMREIEDAGGMAAAVQAGLISKWIAGSREARERAVAHRKRPITGVSEYPLLNETALEREAWKLPQPAPAEAGGSESSDLSAYDKAGTRTAFALDAVRRGATLQNITDALMDGSPATAPRLHAYRLAEPFEDLRDRADALLRQSGARPRAFLATIGSPSQYAARASFTRNLLEAGGVEAVSSGPMADASAAAAAFRDSGCNAAVIVASDAGSVEYAEDTARALRNAGANVILHAGRAKDRDIALRNAGVSEFIFTGCNAPGVLRLIHESQEVAG
ncbi:MAG TPA: methylmalonyl-CoA mutase family protein [Gemmatimonadales bacterium]|nr:methylmalonyl-CoA mutase family protein [Gemmatimonadales bacterium]